MRLKIRFLFLMVFSGLVANVMGQVPNYLYQRDIETPSQVWHSITLPPAIFEKVSKDLADIRIIGITARKDTIVAPYLLKLNKDRYTTKKINFQLINTTSNTEGYFFTFEVPSQEAINQLSLNFKEQNFDWKVTLEGSHHQSEWFTIVKERRILSIQNDQASYAYTKLSFPNIKYRYLRLFIPAAKFPTLLSAKLTAEHFVEGKYRAYPIIRTGIKEDKKQQQTIAEIDLPMIVPLSHLDIYVRDTVDYYRPVTIMYLDDSVETLEGWKYNYRTANQGILSALETNKIKLDQILTNKLKVIIHNGDNMPLQLGSFQVRGNVYELLARFTNPATYRLAYGNSSASKPLYDIEKFEDKIPPNPSPLLLDDEVMNGKLTLAATPLFENKLWLWGVMGTAILVLGTFSVQMMRK